LPPVNPEEHGKYDQNVNGAALPAL
jgi:hypothetical protein